ncbi:protein Shroom4 isoform X2 [Gallus gallus]|uniref:protein Shroom4 isoform X2 n=1 Tax=Gallus gallus TaxID=9031 RepID=UPI000739F0F7|nr:protein Shroom4 isoform X2 [Gallus gallus]|eukprot:XP_015133853.1 protein Shroom4 isoform X2 [Gallus gallus]
MERAEGRPGAVQLVHVQLQGGAPWGFTLRGGLEHGEPLIVSKVEDGGKAALSQRLQPGDELVNISGTPLYGSRQEALILIKGSYRTLKMIVRRRSVPVLRPHSWHMAKLAEIRSDAPAMHCPPDAFSLSWPSGCDVSTDRSSSIGSMESLDQPGHAYYEGTPSPVEHHSKRDSAYSSFSASSNTSDCALSLRPEDAANSEGPCKPPDPRYLQTAAEGADKRHAARHPVPPQPPVRRDSLRASPASGTDRRRVSVPATPLHAQGRWISDTFLCQRDKDGEGSSGRMLAACPPREQLSADQYYMLSSHPDRCAGDGGDRPYPESSAHRAPDAGMETAGDTTLLSPLQGHRHSAPEQLLASQLRALHVSTGSGRASPASPAPDNHRWTTSPLHAEPRGPGGLSPAPSTEGLAEEHRAGGRRGGGPPNRSAHFRRRSERFATNLRNEIQRRKAQLQKSRGPGAQPRGEEPVEEAEEPAEGSPSPAPSEDGRSCVGDTLPGPEVERVAPSRGRWRWSPEHKLQPQRSPSPREHKAAEEAVLLPFADRRRFFEESSRPAPAWHGKPQKAAEPDPFPPAEHRDVRRGSGPYSECCREQPPYYKVLPRHGELEYLRGCPYPYGAPPGMHEPCRYCTGEMCPALLPRGHAYRCHPWARCPDCCCMPRDESSPWAPRKAFMPEFPLEEWEPPAISRKTSQSIGELTHYKPGFQRLGPFRPCFESSEPEWPPCYRTTSTHDLSWDGERPPRSPEPPPEPLHRPLRGRAFSESHLNLEPSSPCARGDFLRVQSEAPGLPKKKGPPPPRPPPPNWEQYRLRRASQHPKDGSGSGTAPPPSRSIAEAVRQRTRSLAAETPPGRPRGTPEPEAELCRVREECSISKDPWEQEDPPQRLSRGRERGWSSECPLPAPSPVGTPGGPHSRSPEGSNARGGRPQPRRMNSEELLWDVAGRDRSLAGILVSPPVTTATVMGELLAAGDRQAWRERIQQDWHQEPQDRQGFEPISPPPGTAGSPPSYAAYYGKAELLGKVKELPEVAEGSSEEEEELERELVEKKLQLVESLSRKLAVLREAQRGLQEDISANGALGEEVAARLQALCTPGEFDKYRLFVGDLDKVVNLLLSLSGRLARVENALSALGPHAASEDKVALREKQRLLAAQLEDAKELREHVGRREEAVGAMVARYLPPEQLQDYRHFVKMKSALTAEQRELDEKIKLGQEQLRCLRESLGQAPTSC